MPSYDACSASSAARFAEIDVQGLASASARPARVIDVPRARRARAGRDPRRGVDPARLPRGADREAPSPTATRRSSCTARAATARLLAARSARRARLHERALARRRVHRAGSAPACRGSMPVSLRPSRRARYSRHMLLPEVGVAGQLKLLDAEGRCASARAGSARRRACTSRPRASARIGIIDDDVVDASNLQRQILHGTDRRRHAEGRERRDARCTSLNPDVKVDKHRDAAHVATTRSICSRRLRRHHRRRRQLRDALPRQRRRAPARQAGDPRVDLPVRGPDRRCSRRTARPATAACIPQPPPPEDAPSCAEAGVLGVLPGIMGVLQATEAIKLILGIGETLAGRLLVYDALDDQVPRAQAAPRSEVPDLRRRRRSQRRSR